MRSDYPISVAEVAVGEAALRFRWVHTGSKRRDEGRYEVTKDEEDRYVFRVASLRNIAETGPYFHDGSVEKLPDAVRIMVKLQLGDVKGGYDLFQRVENRFPEAPEVRAAYAVFLSARGDAVAGQQKFLEIPDRARLKYSDNKYITQTISWPPAMVDTLNKIIRAVGDR